MPVDIEKLNIVRKAGRGTAQDNAFQIFRPDNWVVNYLTAGNM